MSISAKSRTELRSPRTAPNCRDCVFFEHRQWTAGACTRLDSTYAPRVTVMRDLPPSRQLYRGYGSGDRYQGECGPEGKLFIRNGGKN